MSIAGAADLGYALNARVFDAGGDELRDDSGKGRMPASVAWAASVVARVFIEVGKSRRSGTRPIKMEDCRLQVKPSLKPQRDVSASRKKVIYRAYSCFGRAGIS